MRKRRPLKNEQPSGHKITIIVFALILITGLIYFGIHINHKSGGKIDIQTVPTTSMQIATPPAVIVTGNQI